MKDASNQNAGSITYNSDTNELRFAAEGTQLVWNRFYSSRYSVSGQSEDIAVANIYDPIVKIQEVSEKEESTLTGGMFRLYRLGGTNGNTKQYYLTKSTSAAPERRPDRKSVV